MSNSSKILMLGVFNALGAVWNFVMYAVAGWLISLICGVAMAITMAWTMVVYRRTRRFEAGDRYVTSEGDAR